jgi:hypothetical protein
VRVPPKLMAITRDSARAYGKSDPIDALAVARGAAGARPSYEPFINQRPQQSLLRVQQFAGPERPPDGVQCRRSGGRVAVDRLVVQRVPHD